MAFEKYYYLVSSLPMLRLGEDVPFSSQEFLEMCRTSLSDERYRQIASAGLIPDGEPATEIEAQWQAWEIYLRNYLAHERAARRGQSAVPWIHSEPDVFPSSRTDLDDALAVPDPAARERALDECRWRRLNDLSVMHEFDFDALLIYRLKLLLAEKWVGKDAEDSMALLATLVDAAVSQAEQKREITR